MEWFYNSRTAVKLSIGFGLLFLILVGVISFSYYTIHFLSKTNKEFLNQESFQIQDKLNDLLFTEDAIRLSLLSALVSSDQQTLRRNIDAVNDLTVKNTDLMKEISFYQVSNNKIQSYIYKIKDMFELRKKERTDIVIPLILSGKNEEAKLNILTNQKRTFDELRTNVNSLLSEMREEISNGVIKSENEVLQSHMIFVTITVCTLLLCIFLVIFLNKQIASPLNAISNVARMLAAGDLRSVDLPYLKRSDEVGVLSTTFSLMVTNLYEMITQIYDVVTKLESSAVEISGATTQLTSGASETAASVRETTTTIEEVKQTSQIANQKARMVSDYANKSTKISEDGKKAANEINEMIDEIHAQMNLIAESMVKLSEQTQAIGSIIETVDDLSQQSNLLSVNASIEAAKAGEQGKGFAVVAQEVKSLANQSKQATNQVRSILNDIQKATGSSVMATEQGSKSVEKGVQKSEDANESIMMLINSIQDSSNAAIQIATTSQQQLVGMEQAAIAMENINQASQQTLDSAKQLQVSVNDIKELGVRLKQLVSHYKLQDRQSNYMS